MLTPTPPPRPLPQEVWYQLAFQGYPPSEAEWYAATQLLRDHAEGAALVEAFRVRSAGPSAHAPHAALPRCKLSAGSDTELLTQCVRSRRRTLTTISMP